MRLKKTIIALLALSLISGTTALCFAMSVGKQKGDDGQAVREEVVIADRIDMADGLDSNDDSPDDSFDAKDMECERGDGANVDKSIIPEVRDSANPTINENGYRIIPEGAPSPEEVGELNRTPDSGVDDADENHLEGNNEYGDASQDGITIVDGMSPLPVN